MRFQKPQKRVDTEREASAEEAESRQPKPKSVMFNAMLEPKMIIQLNRDGDLDVYLPRPLKTYDDTEK
jgi:hypothetical protein